MQEIEKKFLIKEIPNDLQNYKMINIEQGYLSTTKPAIRIRKYGDDYLLSYKNSIQTEMQTANVYREENLPLTDESYEHLKTKIDGNMIEKNRYCIPLGNELIAELDIFKGKLDGLVFVEVEFETEEKSKKFNPPEWFGKDVTFDYRFRNSYLARVSDVTEILNNL